MADIKDLPVAPDEGKLSPLKKFSNERGADETQEQYHQRLREQNKRIKQVREGRLIWNSAQHGTYKKPTEVKGASQLADLQVGGDPEYATGEDNEEPVYSTGEVSGAVELDSKHTAPPEDQKDG